MWTGDKYQTVLWGKMPVNFKFLDFSKAEVKEAVEYVTRAFPEVLDLVPDFSLLVVGRDSERKKTAVLRPGKDGPVLVFRNNSVDKDLKGLLCEAAVRMRSRSRRMRRGPAQREAQREQPHAGRGSRTRSQS